jgi:hypothetical protein
MIETLKHAFGLCGEHWHPNLFTIVVSGLGLSPLFNYIGYKIKGYYDKNFT